MSVVDDPASTDVGETNKVPEPSGDPLRLTGGELARLVRVPPEVDFSWVVKIEAPELEGASAAEAPPPAP